MLSQNTITYRKLEILSINFKNDYFGFEVISFVYTNVRQKNILFQCIKMISRNTITYRKLEILSINFKNDYFGFE